MKMKMSSGKWRLCCLGLNVLSNYRNLVASPLSLCRLWWPPTGSSMFMVVVMLLICSVLHCLYSVGNEITTTTTRIKFIKLFYLYSLVLTRPVVNIAVNKIDTLRVRYHYSHDQVTIASLLWRHQQSIMTSSAERRPSEWDKGANV